MEKSSFKNALFLLVGATLLTSGTFAYLTIQANAVTAETLRNDAFFVYDAPNALDAFSLLDEEGEPFTNADLEGRWTLVFFGYTFCPDICPLTMASIRQFYNLLDENGEATDVGVVMISVDPERDTQEVLSNYVNYFNPAFTGVTGEYATIYTLARQMNIAFNYVRMDDENYLVNHNGEVMLVDPSGNNVGFFKPPYDPVTMRENFTTLKKYLNR